MLLVGVLSFFFLLVTPACGEKVILLVLEGITENLIERVATPAIDSVISSGALFNLRPAFPAETLPTLQTMMSGQHPEVTGILGEEVMDEFGFKLTPDNTDFWNYNPNLTTLWDINSASKNGKTGAINWPGTLSQLTSSNYDSVRVKWGRQLYDIVDEVNGDDSKEENSDSRKKNTGPRWKRAAGSRLENDDVWEVDSDQGAMSSESGETLDKNATVAGNSTGPGGSQEKNDADDVVAVPSQFYFNKTTDKEWLLWEDQIETTVSWLTKGSLNLVLFFVSQPADSIRSFGPESREADKAVSKVDQLVGALLDALDKGKVLDDVNIVITGLHGFLELSADKTFDISNLVSPKDYKLFGRSPVINLQPNDLNNEMDIYAALQHGDSGKFDLYNKHGLPDRFHYKNNPRVADIVLVAKEGYAFGVTFFEDVKGLNTQANRTHQVSNKYGFAGYDNELESMASFIAMRGPGVVHKKLESKAKPLLLAVDVFPLLCTLLGVVPPPNNGSVKAIRDYLVDTPNQTVQVIKTAINYITKDDNLPLTASVLGGVTFLILLLLCCCAISIRKRRTLGKNHSYRYSSVKSNRRMESRVDGSDGNEDDKIGLLTSALMQEEADLEQV